MLERPWDPDNRRLTSKIVAAYVMLNDAGVLVPPKHVREILWPEGDDEEDDEESETP